jgi:2-hydroxy-6-oxonona-2,4-dienedioate hydrolase
MIEARRAVEQLQAQARIHRTPSGEGRMVWHEWGAGAPLVMLHGGSGSWTHWFRNIPELAMRNRVICADTPGLGDSDMPPGIFSSRHYPESMAMLAGVFAQGLDEIVGAGTAYHLCGFSMGSIAGAFLAAADARRVRSYTMVGGSSFGLPWSGLSGRLQAMTEGMTDPERLEVQRRNLEVIMTHGPADDLAAYLQLRNVERARIRSHGLTDTDTVMHALPGVRAPIAGIWGAHDVYAQPNLETGIPEILQSFDPEATVTTIDGAGHWVMYEAPDAFSEAMEKVLDQGV